MSEPSVQTENRVYGPYYNGAEWVYADPLEVWRKLMEGTGGSLIKIVNDSRSDEDLVAFPAIEALLPAVRVAFDMVPFSKKTGGGATEDDCRRALNGFFEMISKKKETPATTPTSLPSSESVSSPCPPCDSSDYGSTFPASV